MLVHPLPFAEEIKRIYAERIFPNVERYKYYFTIGYTTYPEIAEHDYNVMQRLSVHIRNNSKGVVFFLDFHYILDYNNVTRM